MPDLVAFPAKRDQVGLGVVTQGAAPSDVVNIEIPGASTFLAAPTIAFQDFRDAASHIASGAVSNSQLVFAKLELFMSPCLCRTPLLRNCRGNHGRAPDALFRSSGLQSGAR